MTSVSILYDDHAALDGPAKLRFARRHGERVRPGVITYDSIYTYYALDDEASARVIRNYDDYFAVASMDVPIYKVPLRILYPNPFGATGVVSN